MSSDDPVSDHGRQVVESVEDFDDVEMGGAGSSEEDNAPVTNSAHERGLHGRTVVKREKGSDSGTTSDYGEDSAVDEDPAESHDRSEYQIVPKAEKSSNDENESEDGSGSSKEQEPPLYQVSPGRSGYSPDDNSAASTASPLEQELNEEETVTRNEKKSRKRKSPSQEADRAAVDGATDFRPIKKAKGAFNRAYLELLNEDIEHAASRYAPVAHDPFDERVALPASQIGMVVWTSMEKERFFEALGRLGRDDAAGIAQRVRTKGEMEVRQYTRLLQDGLAIRRQQNELKPLELADFPAAIELSHECCEALEDAADNIVTRQEQFENAAEERKHGSDWLVSQDNHKELAEDETEKDMTQAVNVFRVPEWLLLSERFFMNAPSEDGNWHSVDGGTPSVRLTTLQDFYSLAVTLTKRLVASTLYMAAARVRAESGTRSSIRRSVKVRDVDAAALSLGLLMRKPSLMRCIGRLGLSIYEDPPKPHERDESEPMPYYAVEEELELDEQRNIAGIRRQLGRIALSADSNSMSSDSPAESDVESEAAQSGSGASSDEADSGDEEEAGAEANEAILYSAVDPPQTKRDRQALLRRVKAERAQDRYADAMDAQASYQEEVRMWDEVLGEQRPQGLTDPGPPPPGRRRMKLSVDAAYSVGADWRAKTKVMSEWEARYQGTV